MSAIQITQGQLIAQWKGELASLERQLTAGKNAVTLMHEAQAALRRDDMQGSLETALDLMFGAQLCTSLLNIEFMKERKQQLEEGIKQAESPIAQARLVR